MWQPRISFIVPTLNSAALVEQCLRSLCAIPSSETIIVDNHSVDDTREIAERMGARVFRCGPDQTKRRVFGAPAQRNYGADQALAPIIYFVDIDMVVTPPVVDEAIALIESGADAVIVAEESFGLGFWAKCKALERRCYWGDDNIEAPRLLRKSVFEKLGGLATHVAADDWDLANRLRRGGYRVARTKGYVMHDEGRLTLGRLAFKRYLYCQQMLSYLRENGVNFQQATPARRAYARNWRMLMASPKVAAGMLVMRAVEFTAGAAGLSLEIWRNARARVARRTAE